VQKAKLVLNAISKPAILFINEISMITTRAVCIERSAALPSLSRDNSSSKIRLRFEDECMTNIIVEHGSLTLIS